MYSQSSSTDSIRWVEKMIEVPPSLQFQDFVFDNIGIDGIEPAERLIENQQFGLVQHRDDKLYFLGHALGEFLHFFVPPIPNIEPFEPEFEPIFGLRF